MTTTLNKKYRSAFSTYGFWAVFSILAPVFMLSGLNTANARAGSVYTVAKVKLDVSAKNAVLAKKQALKKGPLQALKLIFKRLAPFRAYDRIDTLTLAEADEVIDSVAIRSERNSSIRYLALLDYSFSPKKLQALLIKKGVPFLDRRSRKQVLMPVFLSPDDSQNKEIATNKRKWWRAWRTIDLKHALTDTKLYKAKNSDHAAWQKIVDGDMAPYNGLRKRYAIEKLLLVDAQLNEEKNKLTLRIFGEDHAGSIDYSQEMPVTNDLQTTYEALAGLAFRIIEGRWREPQISGDVVAVSTSGDGPDIQITSRKLVAETIFLRVNFRGLRDWQQIRSRLQRIPGIQKMQVNSLSPRGADVRMIYPGGADQLQTQISSYGFAIERNSKNLVLRSIQ